MAAVSAAVDSRHPPSTYGKGPCGWLEDRFGVSWQIVPAVLAKYMVSDDAERKARVNQAISQMKKLEIERLSAAYAGE